LSRDVFLHEGTFLADEVRVLSVPDQGAEWLENGLGELV
jgi:hypothetical protein